MADDHDKLIKAGLAWDRAVARLSEDQGRVARNNARRAALAALRSMRRALDNHFPVIPKKRKAPRKPRTGLQRARALQLDGFHPIVSDHSLIRRLVSLGVKPRKGPVARIIAGKLQRVWADDKALWFPTWALAAETDAEIAEAKRSHNKREALRALFLIEQRRKDR